MNTTTKTCTCEGDLKPKPKLYMLAVHTASKQEWNLHYCKYVFEACPEELSKIYQEKYEIHKDDGIREMDLEEVKIK